MKRTAFFIAMSLLAVAGCSNPVPPPAYDQSRAIDQDIEATHVVGPTATSPAFTQKVPSPALTPWRAEETIDMRKEQTGQLPQ